MLGMAGFADDRLIRVLNALILETIYRHRDLPVPTSFLIDKGSWLTVIYKGPVDVDLLLEDRSQIGLGPQVALRESSPFGLARGLVRDSRRIRFQWPRSIVNPVI